MMLATRNCAINKMADIRNCLSSHQHLLQLTSLGCNETSPPELHHQSPTPPDSPTPSLTPVPPVWFQQVFNSKTAAQEVNELVDEKPPRLAPSDQPNTPSTGAAPPSLAPVGLHRDLRSRRHRRGSIAFAWPTKRLFTPAIKRMLKSWLVRRRDNPYPSRAEKESLAGATGLTYMQICNWFANWRRKLRNSSKAASKSQSSAAAGTWGRLIKRYNARACAATAAEQFSISSSDSIWGADSSTDSDLEVVEADDTQLSPEAAFSVDHCYAPRPPPPSTTAPVTRRSPMSGSRSRRRRRRKRRRLAVSVPSAMTSSATAPLPPSPPVQQPTPTQAPAPLLTKWLESAAKYRPSLPWAPRPSSTSGTWATPGQNRRSATRSRPRRRPVANNEGGSIHGRHREELDAAEALTRLSVIAADEFQQKPPFTSFARS